MQQLVSLAKALSDPTRVRIVNALRHADLCVCELVDALELSQSTLSTHLQTLRSANVVTATKRRTWIIYSIEADAREFVDTLFERFGHSDPRLERDLERVDQRMRIRVDGCCVLGSGQLDRKPMEAQAR